jgi:hypothetical protein
MIVSTAVAKVAGAALVAIVSLGACGIQSPGVAPSVQRGDNFEAPGRSPGEVHFCDRRVPPAQC